jgi:hypothetical protein
MKSLNIDLPRLNAAEVILFAMILCALLLCVHALIHMAYRAITGFIARRKAKKKAVLPVNRFKNSVESASESLNDALKSYTLLTVSVIVALVVASFIF